MILAIAHSGDINYELLGTYVEENGVSDIVTTTSSDILEYWCEANGVLFNLFETENRALDSMKVASAAFSMLAFWDYTDNQVATDIQNAEYKKIKVSILKTR